jgi:murein DD-endopeptidase MepM/ murein hydrolase activator NlpD
MRRTFHFLIFFATSCLILQACSSSPSVIPPTSQPTLIPTETLKPQPTALPSATIPATSTTLPVSEICTPLADHELIRITDYISNAYADPIGSNLETGHHGVDFSYIYKDDTDQIIDGTPVQTMFTGRVAGLGADRLPYGNMLVIETAAQDLPEWVREMFQVPAASSLYLLYAHMLAPPTLSIGQELSCGEILGLVGNTGFSGNPHLHLETRVGPSGIALPTMIFYDTQATLAEQAAYTEWRTGPTWTKFDPTPFLEQAGAPHGTSP